jgi:hypothetical protein
VRSAVFTALLFAAGVTAAGSDACAEPPLEIQLAHGSASELETKKQLERLLAQYDLSPWRFTSKIAIDDDAIPHSHPILTLHTRHLRDDDLLLSTYIHEQSHWYFSNHAAQTAQAVVALKQLFPGLPIGFPDGGDTLDSSYEHLMVIAFERDGVIRLLGELRAHAILQFWADDHYRALYRLMLDTTRRKPVWDVMKKVQLLPPAGAKK